MTFIYWGRIRFSECDTPCPELQLVDNKRLIYFCELKLVFILQKY